MIKNGKQPMRNHIITRESFMLRFYVAALSLGSSFALSQSIVPEFGDPESRQIRIVGTTSDGLSTPRDLAFNPENPDQLWIVNKDTDSTSMFIEPGTARQAVDNRKDRYAYHFMEVVSSIAFGDPTYEGHKMTFATCHESRNTYNDSRRGNDFMGPTLWTSDLDVYAKANQNNRLLGSHIDMLHQSPLCMGIAHDRDNRYWVFDGLAGHLVYYDFAADHGPGHDDHSDGIVRRYPEVNLTRVAGVPGHMQMDKPTSMLYIADTGGKRILRVNTQTGSFHKRLRARNEPLAEFSEFTNVEFEVLIANNLKKPSGLAINQERLFISDYETGEIIAFDKETGNELARVQTGARGIMGITVSEAGEIWFVNGLTGTVSFIDL